MPGDKPLAERVENEFDALRRLWHTRPWLALLAVVAIVLLAGPTLGWWWSASKVTELQSHLSEVTTDLRLARQENLGLRETIAPLLKQAAKDFPGEELTTALRKVIERLDPYGKPIRTATATVELTVASTQDINTNFMDAGGYLAFGRGAKPLLVMAAPQCSARQDGKGEVVYRGVFQMDASDSGAGKPLSFLDSAEYLQIGFRPLPDNSEVLGGTAICIFNSEARLEIAIPPQRMVGNIIKAPAPHGFSERSLE